VAVLGAGLAVRGEVVAGIFVVVVSMKILAIHPLLAAAVAVAAAVPAVAAVVAAVAAVVAVNFLAVTVAKAVTVTKAVAAASMVMRLAVGAVMMTLCGILLWTVTASPPVWWGNSGLYRLRIGAVAVAVAAEVAVKVAVSVTCCLNSGVASLWMLRSIDSPTNRLCSTR